MGVYFCKYCKQPSEPVKDANGKDKIRSFGSGFVTRLLRCGHLANIRDQPISEQPTTTVQ